MLVPQLVALFRKVWKGMALLTEVCYWRWDLRVWSLALIPVISALSLRSPQLPVPAATCAACCHTFPHDGLWLSEAISLNKLLVHKCLPWSWCLIPRTGKKSLGHMLRWPLERVEQAHSRLKVLYDTLTDHLLLNSPRTGLLHLFIAYMWCSTDYFCFVCLVCVHILLSWDTGDPIIGWEFLLSSGK